VSFAKRFAIYIDVHRWRVTDNAWNGLTSAAELVVIRFGIVAKLLIPRAPSWIVVIDLSHLRVLRALVVMRKKLRAFHPLAPFVVLLDPRRNRVAN
jgi:hypothetical protein